MLVACPVRWTWRVGTWGVGCGRKRCEEEEGGTAWPKCSDTWAWILCERKDTPRWAWHSFPGSGPWPFLRPSLPTAPGCLLLPEAASLCQLRGGELCGEVEELHLRGLTWDSGHRALHSLHPLSALPPPPPILQ